MRAGEVRRGNALADISARPRDARARVGADRRRTSRARRRARPTTRDRSPRQRPPGTCARSLPRRLSTVARAVVAVAVRARAEAVRHAAAADRDAPVGGALQVHEHVRAVVEQLAAVPCWLCTFFGFIYILLSLHRFHCGDKIFYIISAGYKGKRPADVNKIINSFQVVNPAHQ